MGYFHANERFDDSELGIVAKNIGDHICRYFPQAALLLVCILIVVVIANRIYCYLCCFACYGEVSILFFCLFLFFLLVR